MAAPAPKKRSLLRRFIGHTAFLVNVVVIVWLALCAAASNISPVKAPYLALFSITTPFALAANVFFLFFWLLARRKWRIIFPIITLAATYKLLLVVFAWHYSAKEAKAQPEDFKVMSWNVHGMGVFDKPQQADKDDSIIAFLQRESPDILVMPEYYTIYSNAMKPYSIRILEKCGYRDFRFQLDNSLGSKIYLGIAIFSRFPISNFQTTELDPGVVLVMADIAINKKQTVRVFGVHLQSFLLADKEKAALEDVKHRNREMDMEESKSYVKRFSQAYVRRARQVDKIAGYIVQSPYPVLLCGDFNDLPGSYSYTTIHKSLEDAFAVKGFGFGRTYNMFSPTLRIDYIFFDEKRIQAVSCRRQKTDMSDHNPVIARFRLRPAL